MFGWVSGGRRRDEIVFRERSLAATSGEDLATIRTALSTILPQVRRGQNSLDFVGYAAGDFAHAIRRSAGLEPADGDTLFVTGFFAHLACNHFSFTIGENFKVASTLSMRVVAGADRSESLLRTVNRIHDRMVERDDTLLTVVGRSIAGWSGNPTAEAKERLVALFRIVVEGLAAKA